MISKQPVSHAGKPCTELQRFVDITAPMLELEKNEEILRVRSSAPSRDLVFHCFDYLSKKLWVEGVARPC